MAETICVGGTDLSLRRRELEIVLSELLERFLGVEDVGSRVQIENDDVIEVGGHIG